MEEKHTEPGNSRDTDFSMIQIRSPRILLSSDSDLKQGA
jgi:hypothetical protein